MTRARCYVRVSDKDLEPQDQERELREWAAKLGYEVDRTYTDTISGGGSDRAALREALAAAHRREFDVLLIWALDRLSREGIARMLRYLEQFTACGIRVQSLRESWLDSDSPMWELLVAIFAWVAKQERIRIGERVRAGQARPGRGHSHREEAARRGHGRGPPAPSCRPRMATNRASTEDTYVHPAAAVSAVPKIRHSDEARLPRCGAGFRGR